VSATGILIVTHNSAGHIGACLDGVKPFCAERDIVLVIDNASDDDTGRIAASRPGVRFIQNTDNAGFAGAVNQGFLVLKDDVDAVLLLNPDVILKDVAGDRKAPTDQALPEASVTPLTEMMTACQQSGLACGRLITPSGQTQIGFSFRRFPTPAALFFETVGLNRIWARNPVNRRYRCLDVDHGIAREVDQPAGALLMIRKDVWSCLHGFDEHFYPVWFEDVDFCRRAALAGFRASYVPSVVGVHEGGHSVRQISNSYRRQYWYASLLRYSRKHFERAGQRLIAGGVAVTALIRGIGTALQLQRGSGKRAQMEWIIARTAFVHPVTEPIEMPGLKEGATGATDVSSRVTNEGFPSKQNTERTLKRLHAR
jgi:N-acetylglucosaminyl-diphospho-decaprenol L-rhamnosyltransferase